MAYEEFEAIPRGIETPNIYGPADKALTVDESCMVGSARKNDKAFLQDLIWTQQPQVPVGIDWSSNPNFVFLGSTRIDCVTNKLLTQINGSHLSTQKARVVGLCIAPGGGAPYASGMHALAKSAVILSVGVELTWVGVISQTDATYSVIVSRWSNFTEASNYAGQWRVEVSSSNELRLAIRSDAGVTSTINSGLTIQIGVPTTIHLKVLHSSIVFSVNGVSSEQAATPQTSSGGGGNNVNIAIGTTSAGGYNGHQYSNCAVFYATQGKIFSANPWQIFKPIPAKLKHYIPQQSLLPSKVGVPGLIEQSKRPWAGQPQVPVGIDWGNANASGLIRAYLPQGVGYRDKVREEYLAGVGANSFSAVCNDGLVVCRPTSQGRVIFTSPTNAGVARCVTFITSNISADAWGNLEVIAGDAGGFGENIAFQTSTTTLNVNVGFSVVTSYALSGNRNVVTVRRTETTSEIWVNGKQRTSVTHASGPLIHTNTAFGWAQQKIPLILIHSNFLSDAAITSLHNNPWQIFQPLSYKQFVGKNALPNIQVYREKLIWTSQPQQAVGIDWGNPITRGLVAHEVGTKQPSGTQSIVTSLGKSLQASSSSSGGSVIQNPYSGNNLTVLVVAAPPSTGSNEYIFDGETGTDRDLLARIGSTGNYIWYVAGTEIADSSPLSSSLFDSHGSVVVLRSTQSAQSVFKNGSLFSSRSASLATGASRRLRICSRYSSTEGMVSGGVSLLVIFNRALSDAEIRSISQNPWQIFKPLSRRIENRTPVKPQPLLPKYNPWTSQPQQAVALDLDNPITSGIISAVHAPSKSLVLPSGSISRINQNTVPAFGVRSSGISIEFDGTNNSFVHSVTPMSKQELTLVAWVYQNSSSVADKRICTLSLSTASSSNHWSLGTGTTDGTKLKVSASNIAESPTGQIANNELKKLAATFVGSSMVGYDNGVQVASGVPAISMTTYDRICYGSLSRLSNIAVLNGGIVFAAAWNRCLSAAEIKSISENPWQIFKPIKYLARLK